MFRASCFCFILYSPCFFNPILGAETEPLPFHADGFPAFNKLKRSDVFRNPFLLATNLYQEHLFGFVKDDSGDVSPDRIRTVPDGDVSSDEFILEQMLFVHSDVFSTVHKNNFHRCDTTCFLVCLGLYDFDDET